MRDVPLPLRPILAASSLFGMLSAPQLDLIVDATTSLKVSNNKCVVHQGDIAEGTFWVVYGQVNVSLCSKHGSEKMVAILGPGTCFGMGEMLLDQTHQACVTTSVDSMLLHTERGAMLAAAQQNFGFARELMQCMGRQYYGLMQDIGNSALSAQHRVASYLLRHGQDGDDGVIELASNRSDIAKRLGVTPETLSRVLHDFRADGTLVVNGRRITVLERNRLRALFA